MTTVLSSPQQSSFRQLGDDKYLIKMAEQKKGQGGGGGGKWKGNKRGKKKREIEPIKNKNSFALGKCRLKEFSAEKKGSSST